MASEASLQQTKTSSAVHRCIRKIQKLKKNFYSCIFIGNIILWTLLLHRLLQLIPELPDESVALRQLQQLKEEAHPLLNVLAAHSVQNTKVVHRLLGSEFAIEGQLLPN